jgi:O-antigen ligase
VIGAAAVALAFGSFRTFLTGGNPAGGTIALDRGRLSEDESARARLILSRAELEPGARHPAAGIGLGNVGAGLTTLHSGYLRHQSLIVPGAPIDTHNAYAGLFAELGAPGAAAFLALLAAGFVAPLRARRAVPPEARTLLDGLLAGLAGTAVVTAFTDADRQVFLWWLLGASFALSSALRERERRA